MSSHFGNDISTYACDGLATSISGLTPISDVVYSVCLGGWHAWAQLLGSACMQNSLNGGITARGKAACLRQQLRETHFLCKLAWRCVMTAVMSRKTRIACKWTYAGATTRYSVALGKWVWNSGEDATPTICRS